MGAIKGLANLTLTIVASMVMILLGIVYFMITMWMIKTGAAWAGLADITGDTIILTSGIVTAAAVIGSAIQQ